MPAALLFNGSESTAGLTPAAWGGRLFYDDTPTLLYHNGAFLGDVQLIRNGAALEPALGDDLTRGYWLDSTGSKWHAVQSIGLPELVMNTADAPSYILADGTMGLAHFTFVSGAGSHWLVDLFEFDPATCVWSQIGDTYTSLTSTKPLVGRIGTTAVLLEMPLSGGVKMWGGSAWINHSDPVAQLGLNVFNVLKFKSVGGVPALIGGFRSSATFRSVAALIWTGGAWAKQHTERSNPGAVDAFIHAGVWHFDRRFVSTVAQIFTVNTDGTLNFFSYEPTITVGSRAINHVTSFNGAITVLGNFDTVKVIRTIFEEQDFTFSAENIATISFDPPGGSEVGGGLHRTSFASGALHQLMIQGSKLWVSSTNMNTVNNSAQAVPYQLASWSGTAWTMPPSSTPKGGFNSATQLLSPGNPF